MGIQVPPDSTGKVVETNSPDGVTQRQVVTLGDKTTAANVGAILASGALKIEPGGANTQPVSASSLPLPTGAATAAKQPALGTAGTASSDVITIQGIASMTAVKVDGSGVTQPVSGTVTVQQSTASSLKVDLSGTAANATAIKVDNSAVTQPVQSVGNGSVLAGQQAVTGTAAALATNSCRKALVKALAANTINVYVGPTGVTTGTGFELAPGESVGLDVSNTNLIFVIASTTGASVSWIATN